MVNREALLMHAFKAINGKTVPDLYLNISHFLDHFIMLVFAKAAYDAGRHFGPVSYTHLTLPTKVRV